VLTLSCSFASLAIGGQTVDHPRKAKWARRGGLRRVALWLADLGNLRYSGGDALLDSGLASVVHTL
jgi:hypothetical protein